MKKFLIYYTFIRQPFGSFKAIVFSFLPATVG